MVSEATIEAYKAMAKDSECPSMEAQIRENLERTCDKFAGNEDKLERCLSYLEECAREILEGKNGDVPDEVCFRICRDYFNEEIWKKEDEEKAERYAKAKEKADKAAAKKAAAEARKAAAAARKAEIARKKAAAAEAKKKAEEERKAAMLAKKKADEEAKKAELERMKAEAASEAEAMKAAAVKPEPEQLDFFGLMGV